METLSKENIKLDNKEIVRININGYWKTDDFIKIFQSFTSLSNIDKITASSIDSPMPFHQVLKYNKNLSVKRINYNSPGLIEIIIPFVTSGVIFGLIKYYFPNKKDRLINQEKEIRNRILENEYKIIEMKVDLIKQIIGEEAVVRKKYNYPNKVNPKKIGKNIEYAKNLLRENIAESLKIINSLMEVNKIDKILTLENEDDDKD